MQSIEERAKQIQLFAEDPKNWLKVEVVEKLTRDGIPLEEVEHYCQEIGQLLLIYTVVDGEYRVLTIHVPNTPVGLEVEAHRNRYIELYGFTDKCKFTWVPDNEVFAIWEGYIPG